MCISVFQYFVWFSLTFPVCSKFPDFSLTGKCLPIFSGFPVRVGTLIILLCVRLKYTIICDGTGLTLGMMRPLSSDLATLYT